MKNHIDTNSVIGIKLVTVNGKIKMRKIIYAIIVTALFLALQKLIFDLLYKYEIISGILRGPYLNFWIIKGYATLLLLFSVQKIIRFRKEIAPMKEWIPLCLFSLLLFLISVIFLDL